MIRNTVLTLRNYYYPLGNTAAVSLTQDLPPEQDADILLLGCGDARNILFTCFADNARKIDVTCCDIEPAIHARNILLYSLLIEDKANRNVHRIWNIYYHWNLDKETLELLETQTQRLLKVSESLDQWHSSVYGSSIRFCDARSLLLVRSHWIGYQLQDLSHSKKKHPLSQLQVVIDKAKAHREKQVRGVDLSHQRAASPVGMKAMMDLQKIFEQWWDYGITPSSNTTTLKLTDLNPAFLYSPNKILNVHYALSPLLGIPLSTAYIPISAGFAVSREHESKSSTEHLVDCAKRHFSQWASAFRKAVQNKLVIRIFSGDALTFCCTLRNCRLSMPACSRSMNLFCDNWTNSRLELHSDYGKDENAAPLSFDIIDTSNLADHLGQVNVITVASNLLKYDPFSTLYTEMLVQHNSNLADRFASSFGVDPCSLSLMLGLILPDLFTNATDSFENDLMINEVTKSIGCVRTGTTQARTRLRWKRLRGCQESGIHIESKTLAKFLIQLHDFMFQHENPGSFRSLSELSKQANPCYNRASFALFLNYLRATVVSDWDQCVKDIYHHSFSFDFFDSIKINCVQDLLMSMHLCGVDNGTFHRPTLNDIRGAILAPILPFTAREDAPDLLCVSIRVSRDRLGVLFKRKFEEMGSPALTCSLQGGDPGSTKWLNYFSAVHIVFGKLVQKDASCLRIDEDSAQLFGTADMFASVMVPTWILLQSKRIVPTVKCGFIPNPHNSVNFLKELGPDLCFARSQMTGSDVFVTRYLPGMDSLPTFALVSCQRGKPSSAVTTLTLTHDGSKVDTLIRRVFLVSEVAKAKLAMQSSKVEIDFQTPLKALVSIAQSCRVEVEFPVPVSPFNYKLRVARKSSYIEVEAPLFNPLKENLVSFVFPSFIAKVPCGPTVPLPWTSTRIDLDAMPPIDLREKSAISWLDSHFSTMFSVRERRIRDSSDISLSLAKLDLRTSMKNTLFSIFTSYVGLQDRQVQIFGLQEKPVDIIRTLFIPSCLRLDLINHTVVLDTAMIPNTHAMKNDLRACIFIQALNRSSCAGTVLISQTENRAWQATTPALVERCRTTGTWKHCEECEYVKTREVPLPKGLNEEGEWTICSCGIGKFPQEGYLESLMKKFPDLRYVISRYATRVAIAPIFLVPYIEDCSLTVSQTEEDCDTKERCTKCGRNKRESMQGSKQQGLMRCGKCKIAQYCSKECQKADWKKHRPICSAA